MGDVIEFRASPRRSTGYLQLLAQAGADLALMAEKLEEHAVNLAAEGEWKAWSAACAEGEVAFIDDAALLQTADQHVVALVRIYQLLKVNVEVLSKAAHAGEADTKLR